MSKIEPNKKFKVIGNILRQVEGLGDKQYIELTNELTAVWEDVSKLRCDIILITAEISSLRDELERGIK